MIDLSVDIDLISGFFLKHPIFSFIISVIVGMIWFYFWSSHRQLSNHLPTQITEIKENMKELRKEMKDGFTEVNRDIKRLLEKSK